MEVIAPAMMAPPSKPGRLRRTGSMKRGLVNGFIKRRVETRLFMKSKKRNILAFRVAKPMPTKNENMLTSIKNMNTQAMKTGYET
jgi:hypothetical protein